MSSQTQLVCRGGVQGSDLAALLAVIADRGTDSYVVVNRVDGLAAGVYRYRARGHALALVGAAQSAGRLASCAAQPAPLLGADAVLGLDFEAGGGAVRAAAELGLTGTVVAGFVDSIGALLGLPVADPGRVLVALKRTPS